MYCVKCGVELAESERKCPLCDTPVYYPGLNENPDRPYPEYVKTKDKLSPRGVYFIWTFVFLIGASISLVCDLNLNSSITWSGYVIGAILVSYCIMVLPVWFRKPSPIIFVPADFLPVALYVLYIDLSLSGGWFFPFALPLLASVMAVISSVVILCCTIRKGHLYIFGGASIAMAGVLVLAEYLIGKTFLGGVYFTWSLYPLVAFFLVGTMLIVIAIVKPFRESLKKKFFI